MAKRNIKRDRKGGYTVHLPPEERELLRSLPAQFREVLQTDDPSLRRIFPPAYTDDDVANDEFQRLMREELLEGKLAALEIVEQTAGADHLTGEELEGCSVRSRACASSSARSSTSARRCMPSSSTRTIRAHPPSRCTAT